ncbi:hypothetical protein FRUB_03403 [Fimbriiglobus ruber]|uniref:Uncharacterized protein n=1 Tax=Fimbriiglobus ruber TaxID=1908690 RepID=A0A225DW67_9BACT|nr:hypothetical protein FRUB_03403 [Fimbriiglobus ruber]
MFPMIFGNQISYFAGLKFIDKKAKFGQNPLDEVMKVNSHFLNFV